MGSPYAKSPFDSVSNDELEEYKRIIDRKQRGDTSPIAEDPGDTTDPGMREVTVSTVRVAHPTTPTKEYLGEAEFRDQLERSLSMRHTSPSSQFQRDTLRSRSLGRPGGAAAGGDQTCGDEETDGNRTFSEGEGDTSRATDPDSALSPKKKKKGLRTPSF